MLLAACNRAGSVGALRLTWLGSRLLIVVEALTTTATYAEAQARRRRHRALWLNTIYTYNKRHP